MEGLIMIFAKDVTHGHKYIIFSYYSSKVQYIRTNPNRTIVDKKKITCFKHK